MTTYSQDLRDRVIAAYEATGQKASVCRQFSIARTTLDEWLALREETGSLKPRQHRIRGYGHKVKDLEHFRVWVEQHSPFERIEDLIPQFEQDYNTTISYSNMHKWLKRAGWTPKKSKSSTNKRNR